MLLQRCCLVMLIGGVAHAAACGSSTTSDDDDSSSSSSSNSSSSGSGGSLSDGQCRSADDCDTDHWEDCYAPDASVGCGACFDPEEPCTSDEACKPQGEHFICAPVECACSGAASECKPGCQQDGDCGAAHLVCDTTHRCVAKSCSGDGDCPDHFRCSTDAQPRCLRMTCETDVDCEGYCVLGRCFGKPGYCAEMPA